MAHANPLTADGARDWAYVEPASRRRLRRLFDGAASSLAALHPPAAIALLAAAGRMLNAVGAHGPSAAEVSALFHDLPRERAARIARDIAALRLRNRAAIAMVQDGRTADLAALVRWAPGSDARALLEPGGARLVVAAHIGAFFGIRAALHGTARPVLMLRDLPLAAPEARARVLKQAVDHVRAGGLVVATLDGPGGTSSHEVECLGRRIVLRRGPLALARLTGAPIVPAVCAWTRDHRIEVRLERSIEVPARAGWTSHEVEHDLAAAAARWLDAYLRAEPQQIWLSTLRHYLAAPPGARVGQGVSPV